MKCPPTFAGALTGNAGTTGRRAAGGGTTVDLLQTPSNKVHLVHGHEEEVDIVVGPNDEVHLVHGHEQKVDLVVGSVDKVG